MIAPLRSRSRQGARENLRTAPMSGASRVRLRRARMCVLECLPRQSAFGLSLSIYLFDDSCVDRYSLKEDLSGTVVHSPLAASQEFCICRSKLGVFRLGRNPRRINRLVYAKGAPVEVIDVTAIGPHDRSLSRANPASIRP